ncbi:MAG TPA: HEAT repeat domain-containing protein [Bryobacteraceae bacterium]|nr:HEAT repeat domain-containing protein [Bryobacteraceae bacterium]
MRFLLPALLLPVLFAQTTTERAHGYLSEGLKSYNPDTRKQAVQALGLIGPREPYLSWLQGMLDDKDVEVKLATITSLLDLKNRRTVPALRKAMASGVPEVSFAAAKALWSLKETDGRDTLLAILSGDMKTSSGFITQQMRDSLRMLHTPHTLFLFAVKQGIGFAPVPGLGEGVSSLQGILSDPGVSGRAATALLLAPDKDPLVLAALIDALGDKDGTVRAAAAHAIALRNDPKLADKLVPLLDDKKEAVRLRASAALLRLDLIKRQTGTPRRRLASKKTA